MDLIFYLHSILIGFHSLFNENIVKSTITWTLLEGEDTCPIPVMGRDPVVPAAVRGFQEGFKKRVVHSSEVFVAQSVSLRQKKEVSPDRQSL